MAVHNEQCEVKVLEDALCRAEAGSLLLHRREVLPHWMGCQLGVGGKGRGPTCPRPRSLMG